MSCLLQHQRLAQVALEVEDLEMVDQAEVMMIPWISLKTNTGTEDSVQRQEMKDREAHLEREGLQ